MAIFANFHAARRCKIAPSAIQVLPSRPQARARHTATHSNLGLIRPQLFQNQARHIYGWVLLIPLRRNMFERDLKRAPLACWQGFRIRRDEDFAFAQDYLIQIIAKFDGHFHRANRLDAIVRNCSCYVGELLLQEICGPRHLDVGEMDSLGVPLLRRAKRQLRSGGLCVRLHGPHQQNKSAEKNPNNQNSEQERDRESPSFCAIGAFAWFHGLTRVC
jgi:hypothetical protein